jgi:serine/threonine-protein kinase
MKSVFSVACDRAPGERDAYIESACAGDTELAEEVRKLIAALERPSGLLASSGPGGALAGIAAQASESVLREGDVLAERFQIVRFLDRGGMGEVYEAFDTTLNETVAVKTIRSALALNEAAIEQFKREVRRSRRIASPHVCRVYDLFTDNRAVGTLSFLTMELLRGETLARRLQREGRIAPAEALPLIEQMADAMDVAHRAGVIHRDFKPGNVMLVSAEGVPVRVVITDFGLAYRPQGAGIETSAFEPTTGGTPAYMAPEQVEGRPLTFAADVYAIGIVVYEMVTGRLPFQGETAEETALMRLKTAPPSPRSLAPDLNPWWEEGLLRCLRVDASARPQSPREFVESLRGPRPIVPVRSRRTLLATATTAALGAAALAWWRLRWFPPGPDAATQSIAVLPFENLGGPQDYFTDGLTEDLINSLTQYPQLKVIARESSLRLKGMGLSLVQVGERLGVNVLAMGTLRRSPGHVHVVLRLVNPRNSVQLWSSSYDLAESEVPAAQEQFAAAIATALDVHSPGMTKPVNRVPLPNLDAQELYWMGRYQFRSRTEEGIQRATEYFERAIAKEPNYAAAYSGLADVYSVMAEWNTIPPAEALQRARQAAGKALALNNKLADAWVSLAQVTSIHDRDFAAAEECFMHALRLSPNLVTAHQWLSYMLLKLGRFDQSMWHARRALELDPVSLPANQNLGALLEYTGRDDEAIRQWRKVLDLEPRHTFAHFMIAEVLARRGLESEALREMEANANGVMNDPLGLRTVGIVNAILHHSEPAEDAARRLIAMRARRGVSPCYIAAIYAVLGRNDGAFEWLERAYQEMDAFLTLLQVYPSFQPLRPDPRYGSLLERLGLRK